MLARIYLFMMSSHKLFLSEKNSRFRHAVLYYAILVWSRRTFGYAWRCVDAVCIWGNLLRCHFNIEWKSCHVSVYLLQLITSTCHIMYASLIDISDIFTHSLLLLIRCMKFYIFSTSLFSSIFVHSTDRIIIYKIAVSSYMIPSAINIEYRYDNKDLIDTLSHLRLLWMFKYWYSSRSLYTSYNVLI